MSDCLTLGDFERLDGGSLPPDVGAAAQKHLEECDACRIAFERYREDAAFLAQAKSALVDEPGERFRVSSAGGSSGKKRASSRTPEIEGYRITGVLGQGGMGIVYRAVQVKLNRTVALKVLPAMVGAASPSAVARFRREATAAARLHHTHIVPIYDFGESHDAYYYAMELIVGQPLNVVIKRFADQKAAGASPAQLADMLMTITSEGVIQLPESITRSVSLDDSPAMAAASSGGRGRAYYRQVARWMADAADALHYAHGLGIIHRDIKPANFILSQDGRIMIADFGLAKAVGEETVTLTGSLLGTVRYLSPEQAMARRIPVDHRTDIYSLGATMYELLCFQPTFPGEDDKQVLSAIITREPVAPRNVAPSVPTELETICLKALEKSPEARYATARAFAEDLRRYAHDLPIVAKRPGPVARTVKFVRRHKVPVIAATVIVGLLAASAVVFSIQRERIRQETITRKLEEDHRRRLEVQGLVDTARERQESRDWEGARTAYEQAIARDPDNFRALVNYAIMLKDLYNHVDYGNRNILLNAMSHSERAQQILDAEPWEFRLRQRENIAKLNNTQGVLFKMLERFDQAADYYKKALQDDPNSYFAHENLGAVYVLRDNFDEGERYLKQATSIVGRDRTLNCHIPWRSLASLELFRYGAAAAEASIDNAVHCLSSDYWSNLIRARIRLQLADEQNYRDADVDAAFAGRGLSHHGVAFGRFVARIRALCRLRIDRFDEAIEHAERAIEREGLPTVNHLIIAIAEARRGNREAARRAFDQAIENWPSELQNSGDYLVEAPEGVLWFETADELIQLRQEASLLLAELP